VEREKMSIDRKSVCLGERGGIPLTILKRRAEKKKKKK